MMRSDEFAAYRQGKRSLSPHRCQQLGARYPAIAEVLQWPFALLSSHRWKLKAIDAWNRRYIDDPDPIWGRHTFPGDDLNFDLNRRPVALFDFEGLYERGDAYGFFALAGAYRMYEVQRQPDRQWHAAYDLIRALPGICRDERVRPHAEEVISLTKRLLILLPDTSFRIKVDDDLLWHQIDDPLHEPCREIRLNAGKRGLAIPEPVSPIVPYRYKRCSPHQRPLLLSGGG